MGQPSRRHPRKRGRHEERECGTPLTLVEASLLALALDALLLGGLWLAGEDALLLALVGYVAYGAQLAWLAWVEQLPLRRESAAK
jgi:hypothetical protein